MATASGTAADNPLERDPDIVAEREALRDAAAAPAAAPEAEVKANGGGERKAAEAAVMARCPFASDSARLAMSGRSHAVSAGSKWLLDAVGGVAAIRRMTDRFYHTKFFKDPVLKRFLHSEDDPHSERLSDWIAEKMGDPLVPWTTKRRTRPAVEVPLAGGMTTVVHDRSSAHFAAWHSPKREPHKVGVHFKLDDCRLWMRLMFWSGRQEGLLGDSTPVQRLFTDWFLRFIGHFVAVYERSATWFARESYRWSANADNTAAYEATRRMDDVTGVELRAASAALTLEEAEDNLWPYDDVERV